MRVPQPQAITPKMLFIGVDHPSIACNDVSALADWYCRNLGMRMIVSTGLTPPALLVGYGGLGEGGAVIELMPATDPGPSPRGDSRFQPGIRHIALRIADFDDAYARLKALGVEFISEPGEALGGGRTVLFRDPEGNQLQIVAR